MSRLERIRCDTASGFGALRDEWRALHDRSRADSIFLTWEWLHGWWREFGGAAALRIECLRDRSGTLVGLAPFCVREDGRWPARRALTFLGTIRVSSEYLDLVAAPEAEEAVVDAVAETIRNDVDEWDHLVLPDTLDDSLATRLGRVLQASGDFVVVGESHQVCPFLDLPPDAEAYLRGMGARTREGLRRRVRKLEALGAEVAIVRTRDELEEALEALFTLHALRWSARGLPGNLHEPHVQAFHRDVAARFLENGWLRLHTVRKDGAIIACLYGFARGRKYYFYQTGFDPRWGHVSPGAVLMHRAIEAAIGEGLEEFDYLRGPEAYKDRWTKVSRSTVRLTAVPRSRRATVAWHRGRLAARAAKDAVKRFVPRRWLSHG